MGYKVKAWIAVEELEGIGVSARWKGKPAEIFWLLACLLGQIERQSGVKVDKIITTLSEVCKAEHECRAVTVDLDALKKGEQGK